MPLITYDRDFYFAQMIKYDYPEKGDICVLNKSLPDHPECPHVSGRVRATFLIVGHVYRPVKDEEGNEICEVFLINSVDIGGWVPTVLVNSQSAKVPREMFAAHEKGTLDYIARKKEVQ